MHRPWQRQEVKPVSSNDGWVNEWDEWCDSWAAFEALRTCLYGHEYTKPERRVVRDWDGLLAMLAPGHEHYTALTTVTDEWRAFLQEPDNVIGAAVAIQQHDTIPPPVQVALWIAIADPPCWDWYTQLIIQKLLDAGADLDAPTPATFPYSPGGTVLSAACAAGRSLPTIQFLIACGANLNHGGVSGDTPLHACALDAGLHSCEIINALLEAQADPLYVAAPWLGSFAGRKLGMLISQVQRQRPVHSVLLRVAQMLKDKYPQAYSHGLRSVFRGPATIQGPIWGESQSWLFDQLQAREDSRPPNEASVCVKELCLSA